MYAQVVPGKVEDVLVALRGTKGVRHAVAVIGDWDVMALVHGPDLAGVAEAVLRRIHRVDGVVRTVTAPIVPPEVLGVAGGSLFAAPPMHAETEACYVHLRTSPESTVRVFEALAAMEEVSGIAVVAGEHDLVAEVPLPWEGAARAVLDRIGKIPGVVETRTLVAVPQLTPEDEDRDKFSAWE